jgi:hypothetical protein
MWYALVQLMDIDYSLQWRQYIPPTPIFFFQLLLFLLVGTGSQILSL